MGCERTVRTVLDGLLLGESILRWDRSYLMLRVVEFEYSMKHSLESEDNRSMKILCLDLVSLVPRINPNTKAIVISKGGEKGVDKGKRHWLS